MITTGSRAQVMHGTAKKTGGGLTKKQLKYNKQGKIVSKKASALAKKNNRLVKAGYITRKGIFGVSMMGGMPESPVASVRQLPFPPNVPPYPVASNGPQPNIVRRSSNTPLSNPAYSNTGPSTPSPNRGSSPNILRTPPARTTETDLTNVKIPHIKCDQLTKLTTFNFYDKLGNVLYKMFDEQLRSTIKGRGGKACWYIGLAQFKPTAELLNARFLPTINSTKLFRHEATKYFGEHVNVVDDDEKIVEVLNKEVLNKYDFTKGAIVCSIDPGSGLHVVKICNICDDDIIFACSKELCYIKTTLVKFMSLNIQYIVYETSGVIE